MHIILLLVCFSQLTLSRNFYLDSENKFQNFLLYIDDNVKETNGLLDRIKDHVNKASMALWKATNNMDSNKAGVQFGTVYIRIPKTWSSPAKTITWQQCNTAEFFITANNKHSDGKPFTKQIGKCGEPGNFTRFEESFFQEKSNNEAIAAGKEIMNEFVKLRYGVFSEKPLKNVLTVFNGTDFIDGSCGSSIKWKINTNRMNCLERNTKCNYSIIENQNHNYSVMFDTKTQDSEFFCDNMNRQHNKFAYNLQNRKCNKTSVTNIILKHTDFKENKRTNQFESVKFEVVQGKNRRLVLVLDTSSSMGGIIDNMRKATVAFLESVEDSASVGIVDFNSNGRIHSSLQTMEFKDNRNRLINIVQGLRHMGYTNVPDGLAKGVEVLGGSVSNDDKVFGTIILLTDGQNNRNEPYEYDFIINQIIKKGILVNSIAYGTAADPKMNKLTSETGGKYFFVDPYTVYLDLMGKLSVKQACEIAINQEIKASESIVPINILGRVHESKIAYIDEYLGMDVKLTITVPIDKQHYRKTLISPSNKTYSFSKQVSQSNQMTYEFHIPGKPEVGLYSIRLEQTNVRFRRLAETFFLTVTISAKPDTNNQRIINPNGEISASEIQMVQEDTTILATVDMTTCGILNTENVSVILSMDRPGGQTIEKTMLDDGNGEDAIEDDKIFSVLLYPKDLNNVGYYNFRASVEISNNSTENIIKRNVQLGSLRVSGIKSDHIQDKIPPAQIEKVDLSLPDTRSKIVQIQFPAPGDDGMTGSITQYEIKIIYNFTFMERRTATIEPRKKVQFNLDLETYNISDKFEISVRGIDESNNVGEWSLSVIYNWKIMSVIEDKIPPSKIESIRLNYLGKLKVLRIQFNAPGNDGTNGTVFKYDVMINSSKIYLETFTNIEPKETVDLDVEMGKYEINSYCQIFVRGIDENNNKAEWSDGAYCRKYSVKIFVSIQFLVVSWLFWIAYFGLY